MNETQLTMSAVTFAAELALARVTTANRIADQILAEPEPFEAQIEDNFGKGWDRARERFAELARRAGAVNG